MGTFSTHWHIRGMRNKIKIKGVASSHVDMGCEKGQTSPFLIDKQEENKL